MQPAITLVGALLNRIIEVFLLMSFPCLLIFMLAELPTTAQLLQSCRLLAQKRSDLRICDDKQHQLGGFEDRKGKTGVLCTHLLRSCSPFSPIISCRRNLNEVSFPSLPNTSLLMSRDCAEKKGINSTRFHCKTRQGWQYNAERFGSIRRKER